MFWGFTRLRNKISHFLKELSGFPAPGDKINNLKDFDFPS